MRSDLSVDQAALAQSDAEPVAWDKVRRVLEAARICFKSRDQDPVEMKVLAAIEIILAAPPRPDASAGLIDAAKWHEARAREYGPLPEHGATVTKALQIFQRWNLDCAEALRARAADRSGK